MSSRTGLGLGFWGGERRKERREGRVVWVRRKRMDAGNGNGGELLGLVISGS